MAAGVSEYIERVETDGGEVESDIYVSESVEDLGDFFDDASLVNIPTAYKATKLYSIKPTDGSGDFTFARSTTGTRINESGLIESVGVNVPRINYSSGVPSLLLEPQRTNLLSQSNDFSGWTIVNGTLTANFATSPDGTTNASKINFTTGGELYETVLLTSGATYTLSFYAKVSSGTFDFTFGNIDNTLTSGTATTEWQRFEVTQVAALTLQDIKLDATDTGDLLIYGFQVEEGSYSTSYIPTSGTSVTRNVDLCNSAGDVNTFNDSEGILYVEFEALAEDAESKRITISDGGLTNRITIQLSGKNISGFINVNNVNQYSFFEANQNVTSTIKFAIKYKTNDFAIWINGVEYDTQSSGNTFNLGTLNNITFDSGISSNPFFGKVKQLLYFPTALTDAECTTLTTI